MLRTLPPRPFHQHPSDLTITSHSVDTTGGHSPAVFHVRVALHLREKVSPEFILPAPQFENPTNELSYLCATLRRVMVAVISVVIVKLGGVYFGKAALCLPQQFERLLCGARL